MILSIKISPLPYRSLNVKAQSLLQQLVAILRNTGDVLTGEGFFMYLPFFLTVSSYLILHSTLKVYSL